MAWNHVYRYAYMGTNMYFSKKVFLYLHEISWNIHKYFRQSYFHVQPPSNGWKKNLFQGRVAQQSEGLESHFWQTTEAQDTWAHTVDGSEIRRSPVEVGRLAAYYVQGFIHPGLVVWDFFHEQQWLTMMTMMFGGWADWWQLLFFNAFSDFFCFQV